MTRLQENDGLSVEREKEDVRYNVKKLGKAVVFKISRNVYFLEPF
jgi:hypothetical protein